MLKHSVAVVGTLLLLSACGGGIGLDESSRAVRVANTLPPPDSTLVPIDVAPYRVVPGDEITVSVFGAPELDRTGIVDGAGNFSVPLAGTMTVVGKTPQQIGTELEEKLRGRYLKNPRVAINVKQSANQQTVTIDGDVQAPGIYPVTSRMTLQQAIATARGAAETANLSNVIVFRTVDGQKMAAMFDLKDIRSGRSPDPQIYGNDIVVVGQNAVQKFLRQAAMSMPIFGRFVPVIF